MNIDQALTDELTHVAHLMADAARDVILPYFRSEGLGQENKLAGGYDPVTEADRAGEAVMREILAQHRPDDAILGEEMGTKAGTTGLTWVLDPIDGTRGFVSGTPTWGVLIAVGDTSGPFIGIMDQPYIGERFIGTPEGASLIRGTARRAPLVRSCGIHNFSGSRKLRRWSCLSCGSISRPTYALRDGLLCLCAGRLRSG